jgi:glycosyltransferase involved in cell wall biosynthesis
MDLKISVCSIIKNEETFLEESLKSVRRLAFEIIVVDTGSSDSSVAIAKKCADRVEFFDWKDDFSAARNFAASFATGDWILFLDGDEILETEGASKIREMILKDPEIFAYGISQRNYTNDRSYPLWRSKDESGQGECSDLAVGLEGFSDNLMMKLYRNHSEIRWEGVVHETIVGSCRKLGLKHLEVPVCLVHHLGELKSEAFRNEKKAYYLKLAIEKLKTDPSHENPWFEVGISFSNLGRFEEAERAFAEALVRRPSWAEAKLFRARILLRLGRNEEAELLLRELLSANEFKEEAEAHLSTALLYEGKMNEAESVIEQAFQGGANHLSLHVNAGTLYFERGDFEKSRKHFIEALKINPRDSFLREALQKANSALKLA